MSPRTSRLSAGLLTVLTGAALALSPPVSASAADDDLAPVLGTAANDRYIVVFDDNVAHARVDAARSTARSKGAKVSKTFRTVLDGFAAELTDEALESLRSNPRVAYIEPDRPVTLTETQTPATWGIDRIDQRNLPLSNSYTYTRTGAGVTAYIIDTGIRAAHAEFSGRVRPGFTAINDGQGTNDCNGHGTHVAGTVGGETYGVAKDVTLVPVRVLGCNGSGSNSGVIAGVDWVTSNHSAGAPAVANMSLGGGVSTALDTAVNNSIADGVTYTLAAGNDSGANACNGSPSRVAAGLTVGSSTRTDARSSFSNIGSCLDLFAPGSDITAAWITSNTATRTISGTSMAAPHVAGAAALHLQANPSASPAAVANALVSNATTGVLSNVGSGSPNRLLFVGTGGTSPTPTPPPTGCSLPETFTGSLSGTGAANIQPGGSYYYSAAGTHVGCLTGPSGTDFDLYLQRWNGWTWANVASGTSASSSESITYSGSAGNYRWRIVSYSGSGSYTFGLDRP